ncbi:hypothetical protein SAY87_021128 [Trapa incisa]|uniref:Uncharacterized protein n=1 Tax=Trapa incisa TaxID=236973 RepID=A0AAN7PVF1_9MYRT|nr:hypothetical protein SAY87_021128 [Trapa incisa]
MHQKKSEVQIGKESSGISSDFNPIPSAYLHHPTKQVILHHHQQQHPPPRPPSPRHQQQQYHHQKLGPNPNFPESAHNYPPEHYTIQVQHDTVAPSSTPYKRPTLTQTPSLLSKSRTLYTLHHSPPDRKTHKPSLLPLSVVVAAKSSAFHFVRRLKHIRRLRAHLRLILFLSLPFFYFLVSHPSRSSIIDIVSAIAFSAALLFSLNLAIPRLPSIRLFLARSFPIKLNAPNLVSEQPLPVFWSIGSRPKLEKRVNSGCWVQVYSNGDVYEGEFHKGKCSGSGVYYYYMSGRYEGDWVDGKYDGYGVETWARGSRYRGQYRQGLRNGYGVYRFYTGNVYAGEWSNGQSHGCGIHTCEDGSRYVGEFKWGVKHGLGHYYFRNGDRYSGEYFADKMHGFGVYSFGNAHRYEGSWHEGRRQGLGMYTFRNGETQSGHWQNGILDIPSTQNTIAVSPVTVYHSKVLNAVQEARRAAERAYDIAKVDESVNRAVAAANKSANAARVAAVKAVQKQMQYKGHSENLPIQVA